MAEEIQVKLPIQLKPIMDEIKRIRAKKLECTDNKQIAIDAIKAYHESLCK